MARGFLSKGFSLKDYSAKINFNGIDLNIFKPRENNLREKYNIPENKFIILGCSFAWGFRKGQDVFIKLAQDLDEKKFQIVMVGTDNKNLPGNIIQIPITFSQYELAEIYSGSDVLANPTREENYPTVNLESLACGTPVVSFNSGGTPETFDETCGISIERDDYENFKNALIRVCEQKIFNREDCAKYAREHHDGNKKLMEYVNLYDEMLNTKR